MVYAHTKNCTAIYTIAHAHITAQLHSTRVLCVHAHVQRAQARVGAAVSD